MSIQRCAAGTASSPAYGFTSQSSSEPGGDREGERHPGPRLEPAHAARGPAVPRASGRGSTRAPSPRATPASTASAGPSSGSTSGGTGAGGGAGVAPTSARNCASASAARNGATQAATQRSHAQHVHLPAPRARANASTEATSTGSSSDAGEQREHPARQHLAHGLDVALGPVLRARALVERGERPQRGAPERAEPVLVDRLDGPVAVRRQLPAARRSEPRRSPSRAARPARRCRSGTTAARAGRTMPLPPSEPPSSVADRVRHGALEPDAGAARVVRPRPGAAGRVLECAPRSEITSTASTSSGAGSVSTRAQCAPTSPRSEPSTDASTSVFWDGRPWYTRASCISAAVSAALPGASGTLPRRARPRSRSGGASVRRARPITFTRSRPACVKRCTSGCPLARREPACGERVRHELGGRAVPARARAPVRGVGRDSGRQVGRLGAVEQHVRGQPLRQRPAVCSGTRTSPKRPPAGPARTPPCIPAARSLRLNLQF